MNKEKVKSNVCSIKDCGRQTHNKSKYCIFHAKPKEKEEKEFKKALKEYIEKIKKTEKAEYNFSNFIFLGDINFEKDFKVYTFKNADFVHATFEGNAYFVFTTFKGDANFIYTTFKGNTKFGDATFKGYVNFGNATFKDETDFSHINFEENVDFVFATFKGIADFDSTTFKSHSNFNYTTFEGDSDFGYATFIGDTYFGNANFEGDADFRFATFTGIADFDSASFKGNTDFSQSTFPSGNILSLKVKNSGVISFMYTSLENVYLNLNLAEGVLIDFVNARLRNTKMKKYDIDGHIIQEKIKDFSEAKEIYLLLKNNFHSIGKYEDESWAFEKEKNMERLSYSFNSFTKNIESKEKKGRGKVLKEKKSKFTLFFNWLRTKYFRKWISLIFSNILYGYGERPQNVIFSALFIIILFSIFFSILGITSPEIIEMEGPTVQEIFNSNSEILFKGNLLNKTTNYFLDCLYFSVITFTTLGFGDFRPLEGWSRIFAGTEAFIGAFMIALFVYTFARRTGGR